MDMFFLLLLIFIFGWFCGSIFELTLMKLHKPKGAVNGRRRPN